jgi:predicted nucleic acid-binding protein
LILLDANALVSFLLDEPGASEVEELMQSRECGVPTPCVSEVRDLLIRRHAITEEKFQERTAHLVGVNMVDLPIDIQVARWAGDIRAAHYSRLEAPLSLADCLLLASAEEEDEIATADSAVIRVARALDIGTIPLLDSRGRRPG